MNPPHDPAANPGGGTPTDRPNQITAAHLAKLALAYVRQSSPGQVRLNTGSTESQRALVQVALRWGWPESRIRLIDDDLGLSGTTADRRSGFQTLLNLIDQGRVGLVLVRDVSRLSRDPFVAELFLSKAIRAGVLIYANGRVFDSATEDLADLFGLRIQALLAWFENRFHAKRMVDYKAAKVQQGFAVARPPLGYVRVMRGKWAKDPDPEVRGTVQRIFDLALECQSIGKLIRYLNEHQIRLPRRVAGQLVWEPPARSSVANILANPNYTPDYYYRRRREFPKPTGRGYRAQFRPASEWLISRDHHEGYVSRDQWQTIQDAFKSRRPSVRPPLGKGAALLQGLVWCPQCERWMWTSYHRRRGTIRLASYLCRRKDRWSQPRHPHLVGDAEVIDALVVEHVLATLVKVDHDTAVAVIEQAQAEQRGLRESRRRALQRADADVRVAKERYLAVSSEHQLVKADLEAAYEEAIRRRDTLKEQIDAAGDPEEIVFTPQDSAELCRLTQRLEALWTGSTTTTEDRKQLLRLVLERVIVLTSTKEDLEVELVWAGGGRERLPVRRRAQLDARVRALQHAGKDPGTIAAELQAAGVPSITGKPASRDIVKRSLTRVGLNEKAIRQRIMARIRELLLERNHSRTQIMQVLDREFPLPQGQWSSDRLYRAIRTLRRGVPGIEPLPAGLVENSDMAAVMALVEQWRNEGKAWRVIADDLNAMGLRPARAAKFSLFQVMELARRRTGRVPPRTRAPWKRLSAGKLRAETPRGDRPPEP